MDSNVPQVSQIITACSVAAVLFALMGYILHLVGNRRAHTAYRSKGYLRPPTGWQWVHFMRRKHYEGFDDAGVRICFSSCRMCMIAMLISLLITVVFGLCLVLLQNVGSP